MDQYFPRLMLGGNIFGHFTNQKQTEEIICCARALGIRAIDTADVYSEGRSEEYIGAAIQKERDRWFIASKAGLASHASPKGLGKRACLLKKAEESLKRLQTDYIDLYQIHHFDEFTPLEETLETFDELKKRGWIRAGGVSNYSACHIEQISRYTHTIGYHQTPLNITLSGKVDELINTHRKHGLFLVAYSVLARGLFNEKYLQREVPAASRASLSETVRKDLSEAFLAKLNLSMGLSQQYRCCLLSVALHWVLQFDIVKWAIVGVRNPEQLRSVCEAISVKLPYGCLESFASVWK